MGSKKPVDAQVSRTDLFRIDPESVRVSQGFVNGRHFAHSDDEIYRLAVNIAENGQQQPCQLRTVTDEETGTRVGELIVGFGRYRAVCLINSGDYPELQEKAQLKDGENLKLLTQINTINDQQALLKNIAENSHRSETTCVDDAFNQQKFRNEFGWSDEKIAEYWGHTWQWVQRLKNLLNMDKTTLWHLHSTKGVDVSLVLEMKDLTAKQRQSAFKNNTRDNGTIDKKGLKNTIRYHRGQKGRTSSRSMSEFRKMFGNLQEDNDAVVARFSSDMMRVIKGEIGEKGLRQAIMRVANQEAYAEAEASTETETQSEDNSSTAETVDEENAEELEEAEEAETEASDNDDDWLGSGLPEDAEPVDPQGLDEMPDDE